MPIAKVMKSLTGFFIDFFYFIFVDKKPNSSNEHK